MKPCPICPGDLNFLYFDIGATLVDETAVWAYRCREQAETAEARARGLTAADIYRAIEEAGTYRTVVERYGFTTVAPYRTERETLYPDAKSTLAALAGKYRLGVLANQSDGLRDRLRRWDIDGYFDIVISSYDYPFAKPDSRLFAVALAEADCAPHEIAMIGDRLDNDIAPAKAAGMRTVWLRQGFGGLQSPRCADETPDAVVASIGELPALFGRGVSGRNGDEL